MYQLSNYTASGNIVNGNEAACELNNYYVKAGQHLADPFSSEWKTNSIELQSHIPQMKFRFIFEKETTSLF